VKAWRRSWLDILVELRKECDHLQELLSSGRDTTGSRRRLRGLVSELDERT
jgi:hypothetical protein